mgnify:FL=1
MELKGLHKRPCLVQNIGIEPPDKPHWHPKPIPWAPLLEEEKHCRTITTSCRGNLLALTTTEAATLSLSVSREGACSRRAAADLRTAAMEKIIAAIAGSPEVFNCDDHAAADCGGQTREEKKHRKFWNVHQYSRNIEFEEFSESEKVLDFSLFLTAIYFKITVLQMAFRKRFTRSCCFAR